MELSWQFTTHYIGYAKYDILMLEHMRQKTGKFWLHPPPMSLEIYSLLYLLDISVHILYIYKRLAAREANRVKLR